MSGGAVVLIGLVALAWLVLTLGVVWWRAGLVAFGDALALAACGVAVSAWTALAAWVGRR